MTSAVPNPPDTGAGATPDAPRAPFTGIRRIQRTQQVRTQLEQAIARGDFKPGDRLPSERQLVETFGVSRITVRAAIRSLEAVGLVTVHQGRGCFVSPLIDDPAPFGHWLSIHHRALVDLLQIRGALDALAAEGAAVRRIPEDLEAIHVAESAFAAAAADGAAPDRLVELDIEFHRAVAGASGNTLLRHVLDDLSRYLGESRRVVLTPSGRPLRSAEEHARLVECIDAGDGPGAKAAVENHIEGVLTVLRELDAAASSASADA